MYCFESLDHWNPFSFYINRSPCFVSVHRTISLVCSSNHQSRFVYLQRHVCIHPTLLHSQLADIVLFEFSILGFKNVFTSFYSLTDMGSHNPPEPTSLLGLVPFSNWCRISQSISGPGADEHIELSMWLRALTAQAQRSNYQGCALPLS